MTAPDGPTLAIDTSTHLSVVAVADRTGSVSRSVIDVGRRHGSRLLDQVAGLLAGVGASPTGLALIVAGTGPGSFTGLRVGLATAKTLAYVTGTPVVGVPSSDALRRAAIGAGLASPTAAVVLPAGARDHYLAPAGATPTLVPPGELPAALEDHECIAVGVPEALVGGAALRRGEAALDGLADALLALGREHARAATGRAQAGVGGDPAMPGVGGDPATLVPAYVALPRGVPETAEDAGWSPDLRSA